MRKSFMRVALLHLDLSGGPQSDNIKKLQQAIATAVQGGATWVITPETALQGYFFALNDGLQSDHGWTAAVKEFCRLAAEYRITLFLGCAEQDTLSENWYNSCLVIGPEGQIIGRHRKLRSHGDAEQWAAKGKVLTPVACAELTAGILICADSWYVNNAIGLKEQGAQVIIVPAAWPPGKCGPGDCWEACSRNTHLPVWVCNQTGNRERFDFSQAESVVIVQGKKALDYRGLEPAALVFDWDFTEQRLVSKHFTILSPEAG